MLEYIDSTVLLSLFKQDTSQSKETYVTARQHILVPCGYKDRYIGTPVAECRVLYKGDESLVVTTDGLSLYLKEGQSGDQGIALPSLVEYRPLIDAIQILNSGATAEEIATAMHQRINEDDLNLAVWELFAQHDVITNGAPENRTQVTNTPSW